MGFDDLHNHGDGANVVAFDNLQVGLVETFTP